MFERFASGARAVVVRAVEAEAPAVGAPRVEAEHLLLALAADESSPAGRLLADAGLNHDATGTALERETERSLAAVGVSAADFGVPPTAVPGPGGRRGRGGRGQFGASAKRALERTARHAAARQAARITPTDVLVGVLRADVGTVPRALAAAGVDRVALLNRAERLAEGESAG